MKAYPQCQKTQFVFGVLAALLLCFACGKSVVGQGAGDSATGGGSGEGDGDNGDGDADSPASGGSNSGPCDEGDFGCLDQGSPAICDSNETWIALPLCPGDRPVCTLGVCTVCAPGDFECRGNAPATCREDGSGFDIEPECSGDTPACLLSARGCGRCVTGAKECQDDTVIECRDGSWIQSEQCAGSTPYCLAGACVECGGGAPRDCSGDTPRVCVDGDWVPEAECTGDTPVCVEATGRCGCAVGTRRCRATDTPETCSAEHVWENKGERCFGNTPVCDDGICICSEGQKRCENPNAVSVCEGADWAAPTACPSTTPVCTGEGECVECALHADCDPGSACIEGHCTSTHKAAGFVACGEEVCEEMPYCCASGETPSCHASCVYECSASWDTSDNKFRCDGDNDCDSGLECRTLVIGYPECPNGAMGSTCTDTGEGLHACDPEEPDACPQGESCSLVWPDRMPTFYACQ